MSRLFAINSVQMPSKYSYFRPGVVAAGDAAGVNDSLQNTALYTTVACVPSSCQMSVMTPGRKARALSRQVLSTVNGPVYSGDCGTGLLPSRV